MQEHCVVFSLLPGRGESARDFMRQLAAGRRAEQERSERRIGIDGERWFLARTAAGELLIGLIDSPDLARAFGLLAVSMEPYDLWFKRRFADVTGIDLNDPPELDAAVLLSSSRETPAELLGGAPASRGGLPLAAVVTPAES